jgi:uncharacterized protein
MLASAQSTWSRPFGQPPSLKDCPATSGPSAHPLAPRGAHAGVMMDPPVLTYDKCLELLSRGAVGRVAVCTPAGPQIVPVNYSIVAEAIVFQATFFSVLGTYAWNTRLAFEVDSVDIAAQHGWSVVATGRGATVDDPAEVAAIRRAWAPKPWPEAVGLIYVRLPWQELTGRGLGPV